MKADRNVQELREELRSLLRRVPPSIISAGVTKTQQYKRDVEKACRALDKGARPAIIESIMAMQIWFNDETPHYHPTVRPSQPGPL